MMPLPTLSRLQNQASDVMFDQGQVLARQQTGVDAHNRPVYGYVAGPVVGCGVTTAVNRRASDSEGNVILVDYVIRLPHGTAVGRRTASASSSGMAGRATRPSSARLSARCSTAKRPLPSTSTR
jgi:hypothetical protein